MYYRFVLIKLFVFLTFLSFQAVAGQNDDNRKLTELGRQMFFDTNLSNPKGQSCASCHAPESAFVEPDAWNPTSEGVNPGHFGNRNTPTAMYMSNSPVFHYDEEEGLYLGGQFWDGRASTLEQQAKMPFLNPIEMANSNEEMVVDKVRKARYAKLFKKVFGQNALDEVEQAYNYIATAIAAYEQTGSFNRYTSKYDYYLAGKAELSEQEERGLILFEREDKGNCAACHQSQPGPNGEPPMFTDFSYDNLGVPKNPNNFFYAMSSNFNPAGEDFVDIGLAGNPQVIKDGRPEQEKGKVKVPTLRNISQTGPWMHNGYFQTLNGVVNFYNSRDTRPTCDNDTASEAEAQLKQCWPVAEVMENVNDDELGSLGLNQEEINDIVAFLKTLADGYNPVKQK